MIYRLLKRLIDLAATVATAPLWLPAMFAATVWTFLVSPGNPFYVSRRVGQFGEEIAVVKIRTMVKNADLIGSGATALNDRRLLPGARVLRMAKIDETPQLLSVLRGDLSLVGPRPELRQYLDLYDEDDRDAILAVKPGLADYATLAFADLQNHLGEGDAEATFLSSFAARKIELRLAYTRNASLRTDLEILVKTPLSLINVFAERARRLNK